MVAEGQVLDLALLDYQCLSQHLGLCQHRHPHVWAVDSEVVKRHAANILPQGLPCTKRQPKQLTWPNPP